MLEADAAARGKVGEPNWKHAEKRKRTLEVNGEETFIQTAAHALSRFVSFFCHLHFE